MADISRIQIESGTYDIKDEIARQSLDKTEKNAMQFPNFFIAPFFSGYGANDSRLLRMYISLDGIHFNATNFTAKNLYNTHASDLYLQYDKFDKKFILAMTSYDSEQDCLIFTSKNFLDWEQHKINLGYLNVHNEKHRWAPAMLVDDDGSLYLSISVEYKRDETKTYFKQVLFKCTDKENLTFNKIGDIILNDESATSNYIDGSWAKKDNAYYFIVKHEDNKAIELYTTTTIEKLNSYALLNDSVAMENVKLESPSLTFTDSTANIYTENYIYYQAMNLQQCKLKDFPTFSKNMRMLDTLIDNSNDYTSNENYNAKHGNVLFVTDDNAKKQILNNCEIGLNSYNAIEKKDRNMYLKTWYNTVERGNIIVAYPDVGWNIGELTEIEIEILNPYNCRFLYFYTSSTNSKITITKINNKNVNIVHAVTDLEKSNCLIFDIEYGIFLNKQYFLDISKIQNDLSENANISYFQGYARGACVNIDMIINVKSLKMGNQTIAKLTEYLPRTVQVLNVFSAGSNGNIEARINLDGSIILNTNLGSGTYHATVCYVN